MMHPTPERRLQPRVPGITVTQPGEFDAPLVTHIYTCEQLGVCQDRADCTCPPAERPTWPPAERTRDDASTPPEAGNVWFMDNHLYDDDGTPDDAITTWPVTGRAIAAFWALIFIAVLACIALVGTAAGYVSAVGL